MTQTRFKKLLGDLYQYYRVDKKDMLGREAHAQYYEVVKSLRDSDAERLYASVLKQLKFFPRVSEIKEIADALKEKPGWKGNEGTCWYCMNRGTIPYYKTGLGVFRDYRYEYASRCPKCAAGENYKAWPAFDAVMGEAALESVMKFNRSKYRGTTPDGQAQNEKAVREYLRGMTG